MGTALARSEAQTDLALRASGYGMPAWPVDGMDVEAVVDGTDRALATVRSGTGPAFLEFQTYRFRAHSMYDPELYRDKSEVVEWRERDPITILFDRMLADGEIDADGLAAIEAAVDIEIERAVEFADASPFEDVATLERHVYAPASARVPEEVAP